MIYYYPYPSFNGRHKFFIITKDNKRVYFGDTRYQHYTEGHLDDERKLRYIKRHKKKEDWDDLNSAGYYSKWFLWTYPTYKEGYKKIINDVYKKGLITKN